MISSWRSSFTPIHGVHEPQNLKDPVPHSPMVTAMLLPKSKRLLAAVVVLQVCCLTWLLPHVSKTITNITPSSIHFCPK